MILLGRTTKQTHMCYTMYLSNQVDICQIYTDQLRHHKVDWLHSDKSSNIHHRIVQQYILKKFKCQILVKLIKRYLIG